MYGGFIDRVHDLLLCGVDPSMVDLNNRDDGDNHYFESDDDSSCYFSSEDEEKIVYEGSDYRVFRETGSLLRAASQPWTPSHHAYLYGPDFRACIASVCLVKVENRD